jgi:hypothetical protein
VLDSLSRAVLCDAAALRCVAECDDTVDDDDDASKATPSFA